MDTKVPLTLDPQFFQKFVWENCLRQDGAMGHVGEILDKDILLEVIEVRDDDGSEEVDHGDRPEEDERDQDEHCKGPTDLVHSK